MSFSFSFFPPTTLSSNLGDAGSKGRHEKRTIPFLCAPRLIKGHNRGRPLALRFQPAKPVTFIRAPGSGWSATGGVGPAGSADTSTVTGTGPEGPRPPPGQSPRTPPGPPVQLWLQASVNAAAAAAHKRRPRAAAARKVCGSGGR